MSWLTRVFGAEPNVPTSRDPADDRWWGPVGMMGAAGEAVTRESAMTVPACYASVQVLSQTISALPGGVFRRGDGDRRERVRNHPLAAVLADPNPEVTGVEFMAQMVDDLATDGNFFAEVSEGQRGPVDQLWRLDPAHVDVERLSDGSRRFRVREPSRPERRLLEDEVWHIARPPRRMGLRGTGPILPGVSTISAAIAVQRYGADFFRNGALPPGFLKMPGSFESDEAKQGYLSAIARWWNGNNRHSPAVLEFGEEWIRAGASNEEAQFLETRRELAMECARLWRMPLHKIGIMEGATFSNIEQQALEFVTDTLLPWLRLLESSINKRLMIARESYFWEFNVAGLLRGDITARYGAYAVARQWGWLSVNEIRSLENMNPIGPAGDRYMEPLNMRSGADPVADGAESPADIAAQQLAILRQTIADAGSPTVMEKSDAL